MANGKLNLLDEELDEESQKYFTESLEAWKESVVNQLVEQMEQEKQAKIEELEEENNAYREQLREEFAEKMLDGLSELKESIRAEVTAEVIKNNPELKIFEQVKELVSPLVSENFKDNAYEDTIAQLSEEVEALRRQQEIQEGAKTLASLLSSYSPRTQKLVLSLIKEGNPEEVTEQFKNIVESLSEVFEEEDKKEDDKEAEDESEEKPEDDGEEPEDDGEEKDESKDDEEKDSDKKEDDVKEESVEDESYITEGYSGYEEPVVSEPKKTFKDVMKAYSI